MNNFFLAFLFFLGSMFLSAQESNFTRKDTLRGSITPEREWWDLTYYHLDIKIDPDQKTISGKNTIYYRVLKGSTVMQIDLQPPLKIEKVIQQGKELQVKSEENAHFITLTHKQKENDLNSLTVFYSGKPREAINAPWDGGISWTKDTNNKHFVASSCQGLGASVWWPNKDHMYDEVDSLLISVNVPDDLMNVSNGRLRKVEEHDDKTKTFHWFVNNPINNYGVNINIGDYTHFGEKYKGEKGELDMDYYVLKDNLDKAKKQFKDAPKMMKAFEHWFGPYPFYEDSFKLVEVPYLGMEHQSSVTYGNKYMNGYLGNDLSGSGWGLKFDFIIIHEAGHEWFANNITYKDAADMWVHEGFTAYSESLFLDYHYGKKASSEYVIGTRKRIQNDRPIIGPYNVNKEGSGDMYLKGSNILHTLRQLIEDDEKWRSVLRGLNSEFYHQTVTTKQIEEYISKTTKIDLTQFFDQYLRTTKIPTLEYSFKDEKLKFRYTNIIEKYDTPVRIFIDNKPKWIQPNADWQTVNLKGDTISVDPNFYINVKSM
ncbi:M1 family peptidase [Aquimarina sp. AD10]|uniref:M1 family metallopeptidase n=1 Tax=Aquimarina sp. AD10 TaxID=1714849 RepID=UPI000E4F9D5E|nr:M1 family metallopeptidase [Aquimarina sp. AD10]AXT60229.1 M1 family peptidase [Aquimarina sp. AD10]RKN01335.1 M1 family peptidase [Aquimarina sp. AD10]